MTLCLTERLALLQDGSDRVRFTSLHPTEGRHVFGGLLVAQALRAASLTVDSSMPARSLHASFVLAGSGGEVLRHEVEQTRDGSSCATRRVTATVAQEVLLRER